MRRSISFAGRISVSETTTDYSFDEHCRLLGKLCITWSIVDRHLTDVMSILIGCGPLITSSLLTAVDSIQARCEAAKNLAIHHKLEESWLSDFSGFLDMIARPVAAKRNRYIHDYWAIDDNGLVRLDLRTKRGKPQSHQPIALKHGEWTATEPEEVHAFVDQVYWVGHVMLGIRGDLAVWRDEGQLPAPSALSKMGDLAGFQCKSPNPA